MGGDFFPSPLDAGRQRILDEVAAIRPTRLSPRGTSPEMFFTSLLHYRLDVERVVGATSSWLECSDPVLIGMITTQDRVGRMLVEAVADVDRWLCALLDPDGRTFELRALIAQHGWPDVDLDQLIADEW